MENVIVILVALADFAIACVVAIAAAIYMDVKDAKLAAKHSKSIKFKAAS